MKLLVVITTHDKYIKNGMLERCKESWEKNLKVLNGSYDFLVINDSERMHLGVTQSRLEGYIQAREKGYDWVTFCDADAVIKKPITIDLADISIMQSCHYGYCNESTSKYNCVDPIPNDVYSIGVIGKHIFSWNDEDRDYPVFMGRFFRVLSLSAEMFVDTKMYGDDGLFFYLYCIKNASSLCRKIKGLITTSVENDKSLPIENVRLGEDYIRWTLNHCANQFPELRDKFIFQKGIIAYLMYTYFRYGQITEKEWEHATSFLWDYRVNLANLDKSQLDFMDKVKSAEDATTFMKNRYSAL